MSTFFDGGDARKLFVGAIPRNYDAMEVNSEINKWGEVSNLYYTKQGYAYVEFRTIKARDAFLRDRHKHKILDHIVDVKPFTPHGGKKGTPSAHMISSATTTSLPSSPKSSASSTSRPPGLPVVAKQQLSFAAKSSATSNTTSTFAVPSLPENNSHTGVIDHYIGTDFGVIRTNTHGTGIFHVESVVICATHKLVCKAQDCPDYLYFKSGYAPLERTMPEGTQVNFRHRIIDYDGFTFQTTFVWPHHSKKPTIVSGIDQPRLDDELVSFMEGKTSSSRVERGPSPISRSSSSLSSIAEASAPLPSESRETRSVSPTNNDDPESVNMRLIDKYLEQLQTLMDFFKEQFGTLHMDDMEFLGLSKLILAHDDQTSDLNHYNVIRDFFQGHRMHVGESKLRQVAALLMVHYHSLKGSKVAVPDDEAMAAYLNRMVHFSNEDSAVSISPIPAHDQERCDSGVVPDNSSDVAESSDLDHAATGSPVFVISPSSSGASFGEANASGKLDVLSTSAFTSVPLAFVFKFNSGGYNMKTSDVKGHGDRYIHMAGSMEEFYTKSVKTDADTTRTLLNALIYTWLTHSKVPLTLKEEFKVNFNNPTALAIRWAKLVHEAWPAEDFVNAGDIVRDTSIYCWKSIYESNIKDDNFLWYLLSIPYALGDGYLYRSRGIVVHYFSDTVGVIQTKQGRVLFDARLAHVYADGGWTRCSSSERLPVGSYVKMDAKPSGGGAKFKYVYASKIWLSPDLREPFTEVCIPGGIGFRNALFSYFEALVKANPTTLTWDSDHYDESAVYLNLFDDTLRKRFRGVASHAEPDSKIQKNSYQQFRGYISEASLRIEEIDRMSATVSALEAAGVTLFDLRKEYLCSALLGVPALFEEVLERVLLEVAVTNPGVGNIVPHLFTFFRTRDQIAEGQLQELQKTVAVGSAENFYSAILKLRKLYPGNYGQTARIEAAPSEQTRDSDVENDVAAEENTSEESEDDVVTISSRNLKYLLDSIEELKAWKETKMREDAKFKEGVQGALTEMCGTLKALASSRKIGEPAKPLTNGTASAASNGVATKPKKCVVRITRDLNSDGEVFEISTTDSGQLLTSAVRSVFGSGVTALRYKSNESRTVRICNEIGDVYETPDDGWGSRLYAVTTPNGATLGPFPLTVNGPFNGAGQLIRGPSPPHQLKPFK